MLLSYFGWPSHYICAYIFWDVQFHFLFIYIINYYTYINLSVSFLPCQFHPHLLSSFTGATSTLIHPVFLLSFLHSLDHHFNSPFQEMHAVPSIIDSLLENFTVCGPASLHLYPDEDPMNTTITAYTHYLGGVNITKENADNLTQVT